MIDHYLKEYVRLVGSVSLPQSEKDRIANHLIRKTKEKREFSGKRFAAASAASAVAVLAISTVLITRVTR